MYKNNEVQMEVGNRISRSFRTSKGSKQGCGLSTSLFKIYLESVRYSWNKKCRNMVLPIGDQTIQVIIAQDREDAEYMTKS
jgi:hypothetical protein